MNKNIEKMSDNTVDQVIEDNIHEIYKVDIESIKNLCEISEKLQENGIEIPGNVTIKGNMTVNNDSNIKGNMSVDNMTTSNNLDINNNMTTKRLDIDAKNGKKTYFNYDNKGKTYFRDTIMDLNNHNIQPSGNYVEKNKTLFIVSESNGKVLQWNDYLSANRARFDNTNRASWERMKIVQ